ncbi:hypothetical protein IJ118_01620 [Candidatus Saccharibacteria bacterium]|nr:hypothetical protein [Candidatus Saccharibacteria bacterium]
MIDLHSHILPGIDDGAKTLADGVEVVRELAAAGVNDIVATPHYIEETIYTSPRKQNLKLIRELRKALAAAGVRVNIYLGNEIYINGEILKLLAAGEISPMAGSKHLLVELPMDGDFPNWEDILLALIQAGHQVILAHPERYASVQKDYGIVDDLVDMGVLLQCNLGSFAGHYGKRAKKTVEKLARDKRIFAMGSDAHRCHGELWNEGLKRMRKYYSEAELHDVLVENPRKVLVK